MSASNIDTLVGLLMTELAARLSEELAATHRGMISQHGSPLGSRRHRAAVKRRIEHGEPGAAVVGRRYLLTHEALQLELAECTPLPSKVSRRPAGQRPGDLDTFERELMGGLQNIREVK